MELPKNGERWVVVSCKTHDNAPGCYVWDYSIFDRIPAHSLERIRCGCAFKEPGGGVSVSAEQKAMVTP